MGTTYTIPDLSKRYTFHVNTFFDSRGKKERRHLSIQEGPRMHKLTVKARVTRLSKWLAKPYPLPRQLLIDYWASDCVPLNVLGSSNSIGWVYHKDRQTFLNQTFLVSHRCNLYFVVCFYLPRQNVFSKRLHGLKKVGFKSVSLNWITK